MSTDSSLCVQGLSAGYGSMRVVHDVSLEVAPRELVGVLGRNGAGKSTTAMAIAGVRHGSSSGTVMVGDRDLSQASVPKVVDAGISLVPEGHRVFSAMSVLENLRMGAYRHRGSPRVVEGQLDLVFDLFPILRDFRRKTVGNLSGGQQQMVAIGQAIMALPKFLILDEPSSGLAVAVVDDIYAAVHRIAEEGLGVLVIEQNVGRALRETDRCYVLEGGSIALAGTSAELSQGERVTQVVTGVASMQSPGPR